MSSRTSYVALTRLIFLTAISVLSITVNGSDPPSESITLEVSESLVKPDANVVFNCRIKSTSDTPTVQFSKRVSVEGEPDVIPVELISTMTSMMAPYKDLGRFHVDRTTDAGFVVYRLTISGVKHEDSGMYGCVDLDLNLDAYKLLQVYHVPESIEFVGYNASDVVEAVENEPITGLTCQASHVIPHAGLTVTIGNRDVTEEFLLTSSTNILCKDIGMVGKTCPLYDNYNMMAETREFRPSYIDHGKQLQCTATMRDFEKDVIRTSITLNVKHGPKVNCTNPLRARINATLVMIRCTVFANPLGSHLNRTWIISGKDEIRLTSPYAGDEYAVQEQFYPDDPTRVDVTLIIQRVSAWHFLNTYKLETINELNDQTTSIQFKEEVNSPPTGGASLASASFWLTGLVTLMCRTYIA